MGTIERVISMFQMNLLLYKGRNIPDNYNLQDEFHKVLDYILSLNEISRKTDIKRDKKVIFLEKFEKDEENGIICIKFSSAKYNQVREVIDTDTLVSKGHLKGKKDGDKEGTHIGIMFEDSENAICSCEYNYYGISFGKIISYLNDMAQKYYNSIDKPKFYKFEYSIIPNDDFLEALRDMRRISLAKFIIDKEDLNTSDFMDLAGRQDIRSEVELIVKPVTTGRSIRSQTIKDYYSKKNSNSRIKRIMVSGEGDRGKIYLDTDLIKTKHTVTVEIENGTEEVKSESIFNEFIDILQN